MNRNHTPASLYLFNRELVRSLPNFHPGADDMCACIEELADEARSYYTNSWGQMNNMSSSKRFAMFIMLSIIMRTRSLAPGSLIRP